MLVPVQSATLDEENRHVAAGRDAFSEVSESETASKQFLLSSLKLQKNLRALNNDHLLQTHLLKSGHSRR